MDEFERDLWKTECEVALLIEKVRTLYKNDTLCWNYRYDRIFSIHNESIMPRFRELGVDLNWDDPDLDYEDDVKAYVDALFALKEFEQINESRSIVLTL